MKLFYCRRQYVPENSLKIYREWVKVYRQIAQYLYFQTICCIFRSICFGLPDSCNLYAD